MASQTHSSNATPTVMPTTTPTTTPTATPTITITHRTIHVRILEVSSGCCIGCGSRCCIGHGRGCGSRWGSQCGSGRGSGCVSILEWAKIWYFYLVSHGTWFGTWNWGMTSRPPKLLSRWIARYFHSFMIRCWPGPCRLPWDNHLEVVFHPADTSISFPGHVKVNYNV